MVTRPVRPATQIQTIVGLRPEGGRRAASHLAEVADSAVAHDHRRGAQLCRRAGAGGWARRSATRCSSRSAASSRSPRRQDADAPKAPAIEGAYQLGRGEARSGRTVEALLAAYRIGARASWRDMSGAAVEAGVDAGQLAKLRRAGLRLHRRAVGGLGRRAHRRAGEQRPRPAAQPRAAGAGPAHRRARRRGRRRCRAGRLGAARRADRAGAARVAGLARRHRPRPGHAPAERRRPGAAGGPCLAARARHRLGRCASYAAPCAARHRRGRRPRSALAGGSCVLPSRPAVRGPRPRRARRLRRAPRLAGAGRRRDPPGPTCARGCSHPSPTCAPRPPRS